jgi:hypothetical protein
MIETIHRTGQNPALNHLNDVYDARKQVIRTVQAQFTLRVNAKSKTYTLRAYRMPGNKLDVVLNETYLGVQSSSMVFLVYPFRFKR